MKNLNIKTFHIPSFMIDAIELDVELDSLEQQIEAAKERMEIIKKKTQEYGIMLEAAAQFKTLIEKCYPKEARTPVIQSAIEKLLEMEFESTEELKNFIASTLFAIYFNKGRDKIFDLNDPRFFDDEKCQKLFDQEIYIPESWLDQFIRCLKEKNANEDMILHNLTPEWMWPKCFTMLIELYKLTGESIKMKK
jgi:hypothetical protein